VSPIEVIAALLVPLFWGVQFVTTKVGVAAIPPPLFGALRFAAAAVLLLPFAGQPARREVEAAAFISAFFGGLGFGLYFAGLHLGSASLSAAVAQLTTPFTELLAWPWRGNWSWRRRCSSTVKSGRSATHPPWPGCRWVTRPQSIP
jgi:O-acetylserine/cysteine efflux transporter